MPNTIPRGIPAETSRKGLSLAQKRLAHLGELYRTGRWQRYFAEQDFLARMRMAIREVELWTAATAIWDDPPPAMPAMTTMPEIVLH